MKNFNSKLVYLRRRDKLTQEEASKKIGITRSSLANYESGSREPSMDIISKIASVYRVDVKSLTDDTIPLNDFSNYYYYYYYYDEKESSTNLPEEERSLLDSRFCKDSPAYNSFSSKVDQMSADLWASKHAAAAAEFRELVTPDMTEEQMHSLSESIRSRYEGYHISQSTDLLSALNELTDEQLDEMFMKLISGKDKDYLLRLASKILEMASRI